MTARVSPKDRFITVYGRKPVAEALDNSEVEVDKVILAQTMRGHDAERIRRAARAKGVRVHTASAHRVQVLAGNGKQDQGVLADVVAPAMRPLADMLGTHAEPDRVLLLDGITTPANVGMILRTATAAGLGGIVVPRKGVASLDPLVIKASSGVAYKAPILRCAHASDAARALVESGYRLYAMNATMNGRATSVFDMSPPSRAAFVLGSETAGISPTVDALVTDRAAIPLHAGVDSLNVSAAAAVLCFELARRSHPARS